MDATESTPSLCGLGFFRFSRRLGIGVPHSTLSHPARSRTNALTPVPRIPSIMFQQRLALLWNVLGLLALANIVTRAVLTASGPLNLIHAEVPNRMIGTFPFMFIPWFFVPLAVVLHVLAIRSITSHTRTALDTP